MLVLGAEVIKLSVMRKKQVQHFIDDRPVTKKEFLGRQNQEMKATYIQQQCLVDNKVFSLGQIRGYEKRDSLHSMRYKGKKYFKKDEVLALVKKSSGIF